MNPSEYRTPGQLIEALLESRDWSKRLLATILGVDETGLSKVIRGKRAIDAELAIALGEVFAVPPERFLELQQAYDLAQARLISRPDPGRATRARLFGDLPIAEMIKRRWLLADDVRDIQKVEDELTRFFGVSTLSEISISPHAAKKTDVAGNVTPSQLAWIYRVTQLAEEMLVAKFDDLSILRAISQLDKLLLAAEEVRKVPRILAECGIRFVLVEQLPRAKIDGVCLWLNERAPVIGMSLRYDRIDNFWFVLRHELEHVRLRHGLASPMLDTELEGENAGIGDGVAEEERLANAAAAQFCVPQDKLADFIARKSPYLSETNIIAFARTMRVHSGLIAGQLQRRTGRYDLFRKHQVKIRSIVAPGATVDGWGDVAPTGDFDVTT